MIAAPKIEALLLRHLSLSDGQGRDQAAQPQVELHEGAQESRASPSEAWHDAQAPLLWHKALDEAQPLPMPGFWPAILQQSGGALVFLACGSCPQQIQSLSPLLSSPPQWQLACGTPDAVGPQLIQSWQPQINDGIGTLLIQAGFLRWARRFEAAESLLQRLLTVAPVQKSLIQNELGVLAWHCGKHEKAVEQWQGNKPDTALSTFNLGVAALVSGDERAAVTHLTKARSLIPAESSWSHLTALYLTLAGN